MTDVPKTMNAERAEVRLTTTDPELGRIDRRLTQSLVLLGSARHCDVVLASDRIDPVHAAIVLLGNTAYLCDLGAASGTSLNGRRIRWTRLADGDQLSIGRFKLFVDLTENVEAVSGEQPEFQLSDEDTIGTVKSIDPVLIIGSDPACDVVLFDEEIEARHGIVIWTQDGPVVRSLQGRKDIRLNRRAISGAALTHGDAIGIGPYELEFGIEICPESMHMADMPGHVMQQASLPANQVLLTSDPKVDPLEIVSGRLMQSSMQDVEHLWPPSDEDDMQVGADEIETPHNEHQQSSSYAAETKLIDQSHELCARVAAAQEALDARAQRHWQRLKEERERLAAYHRKLHQKAAELLEAAKSNVKLRRERASAIKNEASAERLQKITGAGKVAEAATSVSANESNANLQARAARLAAMIKEEREIIDGTESRFEALRLEIERLKAFVDQAEGKFQRQGEELDKRATTLKEAEAEIRNERETLISRIRELDAKFASVRTRQDEVSRNRLELDREGDRIAATRERLAQREDELRIGRERETRRVQKRQMFLKKKAAELAKAARDKRTLIEAEISQRQAVLDQREAELRAHRAALAEAGRAEMERTAADLERVLSAQQQQDSGRRDQADRAEPQTNDASNRDQLADAVSQVAGEPSQLAAHIAQVEESMARAGQIGALQEEVHALRTALRHMGDEQLSTPGGEQTNTTNQTDRGVSHEGTAMRSDFAEKEALLGLQTGQATKE